MTRPTPSSSTLVIFISLLFLIYMISFLLPVFQKLPKSKIGESLYDEATDRYLRMFFIPQPNGTLSRIFPVFFPEGLYHAASTTPIMYKDAIINQVKRTWVRMFLAGEPKPGKKLPIIVYVHGGGFFTGTAGDPISHDMCEATAYHLGVLVVSVTYRLTPEHRLPAAYDDVWEALTWLRDGKDAWIRDYGDLSRCVMMGESAGGNIVYHVGLMAADKNQQLNPLMFRGLVLIQPFFGGAALTASEIRLENAGSLPLYQSLLMWRLALPVGANRSHQYCDPRQGGRGSPLLDRVRDLGWRVGVIASDADPLYDINMELIKLMDSRGVNFRIKISRGEGMSHGVYIYGPQQRKETITFVRSMGFFS